MWPSCSAVKNQDATSVLKKKERKKKKRDRIMVRCSPFANSVASIVQQGCWMNTYTRTYIERPRILHIMQTFTRFPFQSAFILEVDYECWIRSWSLDSTTKAPILHCAIVWFFTANFFHIRRMKHFFGRTATGK